MIKYSSEHLLHYIDNEITYDGDCKLCTQFVKNIQPNLFNKIFGINFTPILKRFENFVWGVGLGQFLEGYTILISNREVLSYSYLTNKEFQELEKVKRIIVDIYLDLYKIKPLILEHGSVGNCYNSGGSCINHAHLLFFPINIDLLTYISKYAKNNNLEQSKITEIESINYLTKQAEIEKPYLYYENCNTDKKYLITNVETIPSQFFRILIHKHLNMKNSWNWREYIGKQEILNSYSKFLSAIKSRII